MTSPARSPRARLAALVVCASILTACAPTPEPIPDPTPSPLFASEAEAYAAAEATFGRYIAALNLVDPSDPHTFEPLFDLSGGSVEKTDRKNFSTMHAEKQQLSGDAHVVSFKPISSDSPFHEVLAFACLDVSEVQITNADGSSGVEPGRPAVYPLELRFVADVDGELAIYAATPTEEYECAVP
jgi:hypothetical protein